MWNKEPIIQTRELSIGYRNKKSNHPIQTNLGLCIYPGKLVCLIGPNGCGKSTLLRTLSGLQPSLHGEILIEGVSLEKQSLERKARLISLVLTDRIEVSNLRVYDLVAMGRNPYTNWLGSLNNQDKEAVNTAIYQVQLDGYQNRFISQLSDGERQRAMIAKALVQDTPVILLDEPTAHLDLPNRVGIMILLKQLAEDTGKAVILSTHELDLALQAADSLWLMAADKGITVGVPEDLILENHIQTVFTGQSFYFDGNTGNFVMNHLRKQQKVNLVAQEQGMYGYWTERALLRNGFINDPAASCIIELNEEKKNWTIKKNGETFTVFSLQELLRKISS